MTKKAPSLTPPLKWHGGKSYLADWIISHMPKHLHYVEPYGGGMAVLLAKDPCDPNLQWGEKSHEKGCSEVVNDLNRELMNFWKVLQNEKAFEKFQRVVGVTPFSQLEWGDALTKMIPKEKINVEAAVAFFVRCRQSRAGNFKSFATLSRNRTRRMMNEQASAWLNCIDGLPDVHDRLRRVVILCDDALKVIRQEDGDKTLFYLDPPYVHHTRSTIDVYQHEMEEQQHEELLETILECKGHVMLSGYPNELYDKKLKGWNRHDREIDNKVSGAKSKAKMTESIWCNF